MLLLGYLWALPTTLVGALLALLSASKPYRVQEGAVFCVWGTWLGVILRAMKKRAMTVGGVIFTATVCTRDSETARHELVHWGQCLRWGPLFIPAFFAMSGVVWAQGKDPYWDNPFEVEARER